MCTFVDLVKTHLTEASALWTDAFHSAAASTVNLSDLEWFLLLQLGELGGGGGGGKRGA